MDSLIKGIAELLLDPKYTDLEIRCDGYSFRVHRAIVCKRSDVLAKECDGAFQEASTRLIKHTVYDHHAMDRMLQWMYRSEYDTDTSSSHGTPYLVLDYQQLAGVSNVDMGDSSALRRFIDVDGNGTTTAHVKEHAQPGQSQHSDSVDSILIAHVHVYAIADYYALPELKALARQKFTALTNALDVLKTSDLISLIEAVYSSTSSEARELRHQLLATAFKHSDSSVDSAEFMTAISEAKCRQEFTADFITFSTRQHRTELDSEQKSHQALVHHLKAKEEQLIHSHAEIVRLLKADVKRATNELWSAKARIGTLETELRSGKISASITSLDKRISALAGSIPQPSPRSARRGRGIANMLTRGSE